MPTYRARIARSSLGNLEPEVQVRFAKGTSHRMARGMLHLLAAFVESASAPSEGWSVQLDAASLAENRGRVFLELRDTTDEESRRGLEALSLIVRLRKELR